MKHKRTGAVLFISAILLCVSCRSASHQEKSEPNSEPVTAILGAFEREVTLLEDRLEERRDRQIEGIRFAGGKLNGRKVVVAWTGVGKVNAAMTTTLLIEHFKPEHIIFTGIAGAVNPQLRPGDIVIAQKTAHHDMGTVWPEGLFVKGVKNPLDGMENPVFFPADAMLVTCAQRAAERAVLDKQMFYILAAKNSSDLVAEMIGLLDSELSAEKGSGIKKSGG